MKNTLLILLTSLSIFCGLEIILQAYYYVEYSKSSSSGDMDISFQFNEDYLVELIPNKEKNFVRMEENGGDSIYWEINANGFRGSDLSKDPEIRIMVYGDSNIQARFSIEESTYVSKLRKYLHNNTNKNIELINAGIVGFGPDQALLKFEKEVKIYDPDIIILNIIAFNDLGDIIRNRLFEINKEGEFQKTSFESGPDEAFATSYKLKFRIWELAKSIRKYLDDRLYPKYENKASKEYQEGVINYFISANKKAFDIYKQGSPRKFSNFDDAYDIDVATDLNSEQAQEKLHLLEGVLKKVKEMADSNGVKVMLLIQPSIIDLTRSNYYIGYDDLESRFPSYRRDAVTNAIAKTSKRLRIDYLNLFPIFLENNPEQLYFQGGDTHWNDKGQDLAARKTASFMLDSLDFNGISHF